MLILGDSNKISQIHPLNAQYLLNAEPHKLYGNREGNLLEIAVERFSHTVSEMLHSHGGIVAVWYRDAATKWRTSFTYILQPDGNISSFQDSSMYPSTGIDIDICHMLLNSIELNGWILQDRIAVEKEIIEEENKRISFWKFWTGITLPRRESSLTGIWGSIARTREHYLRTLK